MATNIDYFYGDARELCRLYEKIEAVDHQLQTEHADTDHEKLIGLRRSLCTEYVNILEQIGNNVLITKLDPDNIYQLKWMHRIKEQEMKRKAELMSEKYITNQELENDIHQVMLGGSSPDYTGITITPVNYQNLSLQGLDFTGAYIYVGRSKYRLEKVVEEFENGK